MINDVFSAVRAVPGDMLVQIEIYRLAILVLTRLGGWIRAAALAPVVYLAAVEWENSFVAQPAVARWILFGSLLIVLMTIRPQGLLGTPRVEVA